MRNLNQMNTTVSGRPKGGGQPRLAGNVAGAKRLQQHGFAAGVQNGLHKGFVDARVKGQPTHGRVKPGVGRRAFGAALCGRGLPRRPFFHGRCKHEFHTGGRQGGKIGTVEGIEILRTLFVHAVAAVQRVLKINRYLPQYRPAVCVSGAGHLHRRDEVFAGVGPGNAHGELRTGEHHRQVQAQQ